VTVNFGLEIIPPESGTSGSYADVLSNRTFCTAVVDNDSAELGEDGSHPAPQTRSFPNRERLVELFCSPRLRFLLVRSAGLVRFIGQGPAEASVG